MTCCFFQTCLEHYNNNTERLVNALFDNTVPEHIKFEESSISNVEDEKPFISKEFSLLEQRLNIYDNDEFDVFNQDNIDLSRIHRGKKFVINNYYVFIYKFFQNTRYISRT